MDPKNADFAFRNAILDLVALPFPFLVFRKVKSTQLLKTRSSSLAGASFFYLPFWFTRSCFSVTNVQ